MTHASMYCGAMLGRITLFIYLVGLSSGAMLGRMTNLYCFTVPKKRLFIMTIFHSGDIGVSLPLS
jgi:hypothetical protein